MFYCVDTRRRERVETWVSNEGVGECNKTSARGSNFFSIVANSLKKKKF